MHSFRKLVNRLQDNLISVLVLSRSTYMNRFETETAAIYPVLRCLHGLITVVCSECSKAGHVTVDLHIHSKGGAIITPTALLSRMKVIFYRVMHTFCFLDFYCLQQIMIFNINIIPLNIDVCNFV